MHELDDNTLLRQYAEQNSEAAFAALVARHLDKVYSVALRYSRNAHAAEEITQAVFVILAKKSGRLGGKVILSSWLYETSRLTALTYIRSEIRRARREQEAHMQTALNENESEAWPHIAPLLDDALAGLSAADRHAIVLRYFDGKSLGEVGAALGASEDAAKKRVTRAVEKLRRFFTKRGVTLTATVLTAAISANSVQAAPLGLATTVTAAAAKGAVVGGSTLTLIKGALKLMAWAKAKTVVVVGTVAILAAGTTAVVVTGLDKGQAPVVEEKLSPEDAYLAGEFTANWRKAPPALFVRTTRFLMKNGAYIYEMGNLAYAAGRNVEFTGLLTVAYRFKPARMVLPPNVPATNFDFLATLPDCPNETFQAAIKNTLGWSAHTEMRETNVLLLKVKIADAPGLIPGVATNHSSRWNYGGNVYHVTNMPISDLREFLEDEIFRQPVLDQTGLTNKYDIILDWHAPPTQSYENSDSLKKVLLDQLGLEVGPGRERIEMLVVERAKMEGSNK
ncbi:MAG TPA: TIGR03435 family protein [Verrucomicrobiae bacterium]